MIIILEQNKVNTRKCNQFRIYSQPPEAAVLQKTQIHVEVTGRREKNRNSDKQRFSRLAEDAYNRARRVRAKSPQEEHREVLKHR